MKKMYYDPDSQAMISEDEIVARYFEKRDEKKRFDWFRIYPHSLECLEDVVASPKFSVLVWILQHLRFGDNKFIGNVRYISERSRISAGTVRRVMELLQHSDCIRKVVGSEWMVNPGIIRAGNESYAARHVDEYYSLPLRRYTRLDSEADPAKPKGEQNDFDGGDLDDSE